MKINDPTPWGLVTRVSGDANMTNFATSAGARIFDGIRLSCGAFNALPEALKLQPKLPKSFTGPKAYEGSEFHGQIPKDFDTNGDWFDLMIDSYFYMCGDEPFIPLAVYGSFPEIRRAAVKKIRESDTLPLTAKVWAKKQGLFND